MANQYLTRVLSLHWMQVACFAAILLWAGCGKDTQQFSNRERERSNLGCLVSIYCHYLAANRGLPPKNEEDLRSYVKALPDELVQRMGATEFDGLMSSPRDNLPYVIVYRDSSNASVIDSGVIVYEQKGVDESRWVGRLTGTTSELSEAAFRNLLPDA